MNIVAISGRSGPGILFNNEFLGIGAKHTYLNPDELVQFFGKASVRVSHFSASQSEPID